MFEYEKNTGHIVKLLSVALTNSPNLRGAGIDTRRLGEAQQRIARNIDAATRKMGRVSIFGSGKETQGRAKPCKYASDIGTVKSMSEATNAKSGMHPKEGSYIGPKTKVKGEIRGSEAFSIAGQVQGNINVSSEPVIVAPEGRVQADINAPKISIQGAVRGNVNGSQRVELRKTGKMEGDLTTARIFIEEGAVFRGRIDVASEEKKAPSDKPEVAQQRKLPGNEAIS